jgi:hypothetical protein
MISDLRPCHQRMIERLQPYKRGNGNRRSPLWLLSELNNADKHRLLQVVAATPSAFIMRGHGMMSSIRGGRDWGIKLKDGTKIVEVAPDPDSKVKMDYHVLPQISFSGGCGAVEGLPVILTLTRITDQVREVVDAFASDSS